MATEKNISSRIIHKHDIEANWNKATNFIPKAGEIIIYDKDETYDYERFKIGDGETKVIDLKFVNWQSDWNQTNSFAPDFIKNRTHYSEIEVFSETHEFVATSAEGGEIEDLEFAKLLWENRKTAKYTDYDGECYFYDDYELYSNTVTWRVTKGSELGYWFIFLYKNESGELNGRIRFGDDGIGMFGTGTITVDVQTEKVHHLDPKYIKDMYYEEDVVTSIEREITFPPTNHDVTYSFEKIPLTIGQQLEVLFKRASDGYDNSFGVGTVEEDENGELVMYIPSSENKQIIIRQTEITIKGGTLYESNCHGVKIVGEVTIKNIHHLDSKYIKDMYYEEDVESTIVNNASVTFEEAEPVFNPFSIEIIEGDIYTVTWDGTTYECTAYVAPGPYAPSIGNGFIAGASGGSDEPFFITVFNGDVRLFGLEIGTHTISISTVHKNIKTIDPKYIKDMYYDNGVTVTELVSSQTISGFALMGDPTYGVENPFELTLAENATYIVNWDGVEYETVCKSHPMGCLYIGNENYVLMQSGGDFPFAVLGFGGVVFVATESSEESHTISITEIKHDLKQIDKKYLPIMEDKVIFSNDTVVNDNVYFNEKKLVGEYFVIFDGVKETVTFVDNYDYSFAVGSSFAIETWNAENDEDGLWIECDDGEHSLIIKEISSVIKEELLSEYIKSDEAAGRNVSGRSFVVDGNDVTADECAEIFNSPDNVAVGYYSHAEGSNTTASGHSSHAEGSATTASGDSSHAEGVFTTASGDYSHAEGRSTKASDNYSHAEGGYTTASKSYSHAEGNKTTASGDSSHAEGRETTASGDYSHAEGDNTKASGNYSHAEGNGTKASKSYSHAEGNRTTASGLASHAEGSITTAYGDSSHAEGGSTTASGLASHAEGRKTTASGDYSHAEGESTIAGSTNQHVQGRYNVEDEVGSYAHIIGNGYTNNRSNAHTLDWDGNAWFQGDVYVGSTSGTNKDEGSVKLLRADEIATDEEILTMLMDSDMFPVVTDSDGSILSDENNNILLW